jgi:hypothetical protein
LFWAESVLSPAASVGPVLPCGEDGGDDGVGDGVAVVAGAVLRGSDMGGAPACAVPVARTPSPARAATAETVTEIVSATIRP